LATSWDMRTCAQARRRNGRPSEGAVKGEPPPGTCTRASYAHGTCTQAEQTRPDNDFQSPCCQSLQRGCNQGWPQSLSRGPPRPPSWLRTDRVQHRKDTAQGQGQGLTAAGECGMCSAGVHSNGFFSGCHCDCDYIRETLVLDYVMLRGRPLERVLLGAPLRL
jgi:hypothetical protein